MRVHVIVTTHTPRRLAGVLAGLSRQSERPESITVTCDTDDPAIGAVLDRWHPGFKDVPLRWVRRAHTGDPRPAQTRNNGVRVLKDTGILSDEDLILMLDGDIVLKDGAVAAHRALVKEGYEVIIAYRIPLDSAATEIFDAYSYARGGLELEADDAHMKSLHRLQKKYERDLRFRRLPWARPHRPKMIGCHHAVTARVFHRVNGYDEEYLGYASEDDDFSRRVNTLRPVPRISIAVERIPAFHLWHESRDTPDRKSSVAYRRFKRGGLPLRAEHGFDDPREQPEPEVSIVE